jgi:hypothetical protein
VAREEKFMFSGESMKDMLSQGTTKDLFSQPGKNISEQNGGERSCHSHLF